MRRALAIDISPADQHDAKGIVPVVRLVAEGGLKGPTLGEAGQGSAGTAGNQLLSHCGIWPIALRSHVVSLSIYHLPQTPIKTCDQLGILDNVIAPGGPSESVASRAHNIPPV